jgi:ferredoxin
MKIAVDTSKCHGHGRCYDIAPDVFTADDEGYVKLLETGELPEVLQADARLAVLNCPENALSVIE